MIHPSKNSTTDQPAARSRVVDLDAARRSAAHLVVSEVGGQPDLEPRGPARVLTGRFGRDARSPTGSGNRGGAVSGADSGASRRPEPEQVGDNASGGLLAGAVKAPRLLIVDHEASRCDELGELFEELGYDAYEAMSVEQAEAWWRHLGDLDVVLVNLEMPGRGAFELLARLARGRSDEHHPAFIALVPQAQRRAALEAMNAGAFDWQTMPLDVPMLMHAVGRATEQVRLRRVDRLFQHLINNIV